MGKLRARRLCEAGRRRQELAHQPLAHRLDHLPLPLREAGQPPQSRVGLLPAGALRPPVDAGERGGLPAREEPPREALGFGEDELLGSPRLGTDGRGQRSEDLGEVLQVVDLGLPPVQLRVDVPREGEVEDDPPLLVEVALLQDVAAVLGGGDYEVAPRGDLSGPRARRAWRARRMGATPSSSRRRASRLRAGWRPASWSFRCR